MSYVSSIKAIKLKEVLVYKSDISTKELKEFKSSNDIYL